MHLVTVGKYTFNLDNVTEVTDYGDSLFLGYLAAWPDGSACSFAGRRLDGDDADVMRRYLARLSENAAAQVR